MVQIHSPRPFFSKRYPRHLFSIHALFTFGENNGHWNFGFDIGAGAGLFGSLDVDCDCGVNAHAGGDLGAVLPDLFGDVGLGGDINVNQTDGPSYGFDIDDPDLPDGYRQWTYDPAGPQPHPSFGLGGGAFAGVGYTWCH